MYYVLLGRVYTLLDVLVRSLNFDDGHTDDFEDDVLLFGEESKSKVFKTKIIGFAETTPVYFLRGNLYISLRWRISWMRKARPPGKDDI